MKSEKADAWIVITGRPIYSCRTRKQARKYAKENIVDYPQYNYVGKCIKNYKQIVLNV